MIKTNSQRNSGFTLIEMLVAVALFSIVLMIAMGSIITIVDVNRKSQSLTTVMNDLNFSLENMTRTIKTGVLQDPSSSDGRDWNSITVINQDDEKIVFSFDQGKGAIMRKKDSEDAFPFTSEQIHIDDLRFRVFSGDSNLQPRVLIMLEGTASTSPSISSNFIIQTSVSQRDLRTDRFK